MESGREPLYPMMLESPELRWSFIRKIYSIVSIQLLLTIAVASLVVTVHPISQFFTTTRAGLALYIVLVITPFVGRVFFFFVFLVELITFLVKLIVLIVGINWIAVLCPLSSYYRKHPLNYILLGIFTVSLSFAVGLTCSYTSGERLFMLSFFFSIFILIDD